MINVNDFAHIGLFFVSALVFALGTGILGGIITGFDYEYSSFAAWLVAIIVYGITFVILYQMR